MDLHRQIEAAFGVPLVVSYGLSEATCTSTMNKRNNNEPYSFHTGGGNFLFGDGHVQFVRDGVDIRTFSALLTKSAGEVVGGEY